MSAKFHIKLKRNNGNLHLRVAGIFDGSSAWQLVNLLHKKYDGKGQVFIDTNGLRDIYPFGCSTFQCQLNPRRLPANRLVFKGEKGLEIAPDGSKVIVAPGRQSDHPGGPDHDRRHQGDGPHRLVAHRVRPAADRAGGRSGDDNYLPPNNLTCVLSAFRPA